MQYVNYLADVLGQDSTDRRPLDELIQNSLLRQFLETSNYQVVSFQTGFSATEWRDADYFLVADHQPGSRRSAAISLLGFDYNLALNDFENLLLETTLLRAFLGSGFLSRTSVGHVLSNPGYQFHRDRVISTLSHVSDFASLEGNYFVFAHIVSPHPPFVFGPNGENVQPDREYSRGDAFFDGTVEEYISGYRGQIQYVNKLVADAVITILENSVVPPIIIIQGDHGPAAFLDWESPQDANLDERFSILNAYYFPDGDYTDLYPSITPVNSFRIVLNQYFGAGYELLTDENFLSVWYTPYDFTDVTDELAAP
jgi:hypothetical protein